MPGISDERAGGMRWDPARYDRYRRERSRPFHDLVSRIEAEAPRRVVDLGCGPGTLTATLAERWPDAEVVGVDASPEMLADAAPLAEAHPGLSFVEQRIEDWRPTDRDDVVVTNAALQWVPTHAELLPRWLDALPAGAWFAMQVPANFASPSHRLMRTIATEGPWSDVLDGVLRDEPVLEPTAYQEILADAGFAPLAWETTYLQLLPGEDPVLDWTRGTGLRPALATLDAADPTGALTDAYVERYRTALREAYPRGPHGTVFPFRRLFAVGQKVAG